MSGDNKDLLIDIARLALYGGRNPYERPKSDTIDVRGTVSFRPMYERTTRTFEVVVTVRPVDEPKDDE